MEIDAEVSILVNCLIEFPCEKLRILNYFLMRSSLSSFSIVFMVFSLLRFSRSFGITFDNLYFLESHKFMSYITLASGLNAILFSNPQFSHHCQFIQSCFLRFTLKLSNCFLLTYFCISSLLISLLSFLRFTL